MPEAELAPQDEDSQEVPHDTLQVATSHQVEAPQETPPAEAPQVAAPQAKTPKMNPKTAALVEAIKAEVLRLRKSAGYTTDDYTRLKTRLEKKGLKGETLLTEILTCLKKK
jgi:predicted component of type VI protein secretion system